VRWSDFARGSALSAASTEVVKKKQGWRDSKSRQFVDQADTFEKD